MCEGCNFIRFWPGPLLKTVQNSLETVSFVCSSVFKYVLASFPAHRVTNFILVSAFLMCDSTVSMRSSTSSLQSLNLWCKPASSVQSIWGPWMYCIFWCAIFSIMILWFGSLYFWHHVIFSYMYMNHAFVDFINFIRILFHLQHRYMLSQWGPGCYWKFPLKTMTQENYYGDLHMRCWLGDLYNTTITTLA